MWHKFNQADDLSKDARLIEDLHLVVQNYQKQITAFKATIKFAKNQIDDFNHVIYDIQSILKSNPNLDELTQSELKWLLCKFSLTVERLDFFVGIYVNALEDAKTLSKDLKD